MTTTDVLVESVHFSEQTTPPYSVGWRAVAVNLSDLAAMGAEPLAVTVALGLPGYTPLDWVEELYRGMSDCLKKYGGEIVGGDLCRSNSRMVSVTALGDVQPTQMIRRNAAMPEMTVVVTGAHGASRAGLAILLDELAADDKESTPFAATWIAAHQRPIPRFDAIAALREIIQDQSEPTVTRAYPVIAGMDSSDGLANALLQLSSSSGVGMNIMRSQIPLAVGLSDTVGFEAALDWALYGGEDFELVLCLPPALADVFTKTPFGIAIGTTTGNSGIVNLYPTLAKEKGILLTHQEFQHF